MDSLSSFISENASFFNTYGNLILIPLFLIILFIDHKISKKALPRLIKFSLKAVFIVSLFFLGSLTYMINIPLKPMVNSLSKVQDNIGQQIYDFEFVDIRAGQIKAISDFQGKLILLNFWGTYCAPCIEEFPDLKKIESVYSDHVRVIALSDEDEDRIMSFIERVESPRIVGSFSSEAWIELESFRPLTIIIDQKGIVREYTFGKKDYTYFELAIAKYL